MAERPRPTDGSGDRLERGGGDRCTRTGAVPRFDPFVGVRYDLTRFDPADVTAPPYDVLSAEGRAALCARSSHNVVCIDVPVESEGADRYRHAAERFGQWRAEGALLTDRAPTFTIYEIAFDDDHGRPATTLGVIGALALSPPGEGDVLPHELTTPKARSDRLDLLRATQANLSAVWGLSLQAGLSDLLHVPGEPDARWTDDDAVTHTVWTLTDRARQDEIAAAVAQSPVVIADGHHRYETALAYRDERRALDGTGGPADATMCLVVELTAGQLTVRPIHRLISGLPDGFDLREALIGARLRGAGTVSAAEVTDGRVLDRMAASGAVALIGPNGGAELLAVDVAAFQGVPDLDSARLAHVFATLTDQRAVEVTIGHQHGTDLVHEAVLAGEAQYGVLLRPATVGQIQANAHAGDRMPAKTTFFHPKPKTGVVFRPLA